MSRRHWHSWGHPQECPDRSQLEPSDQLTHPATLLFPYTWFWCQPVRPSPQSQSSSRGYGSNLPTSLTDIVLLTRGCSPWRPAADIGTAHLKSNTHPKDFQGPPPVLWACPGQLMWHIQPRSGMWLPSPGLGGLGLGEGGLGCPLCGWERCLSPSEVWPIGCAVVVLPILTHPSIHQTNQSTHPPTDPYTYSPTHPSIQSHLLPSWEGV